jgi:site-specific DNA-methyltransferase (adenine-specific)/adenine-specific DNA-methyltransferase
MSNDDATIDRVEQYTFEPIKGYPMLQWHGKRPFTSTQYYPAQHKETYGPEVQGWRNKLYWGDNLQVMSHLLKKYRDRIKLAYIDPPFDSKADYRIKVQVRGKITSNSQNSFEEKQYSDIWTNDEYLQFIYDRITLIRELLSNDGSLWLHCDWHRSHHLRCILDEVFGACNLQNEVVWQRTDPHNDAKSRLGWIHDTIFWYAKSRESVHYNWADVMTPLSDAALKEYSLVRLTDNSVMSYYDGYSSIGRRFKLDDCTYKGNDSRRQFDWRGARPSPKRVWPYATIEDMDAALERGEFYLRDKNKGAARCRVSYLDERPGQLLQTIWTDTGRMKGGVTYPTEKPESLLERIIKASSNPGDLVFDCFMGSGTTQAVAMKLGRRFIGADINLGAVQTTTKRLISLGSRLQQPQGKLNLDSDSDAPSTLYTGFEVYNVNNYDIFRNPVEAKELLLQALEVNRLQAGSLFDGEKDGRLVKIMPVNRITTRQDLNELITGFDYRAFERRQAERPTQPVERITLVCMGHEPGLAAHLQREVPYRLDIEVVDILRDKQEIQFKRDAEAKMTVQGDQLVIERFYPMNLLAKLSLQQEHVGDWRELVESVLIDWNYDGAVLQPTLIDAPEGDELVVGRYAIPADAGTIRVKITDLLSESLEQEVRHG